MVGVMRTNGQSRAHSGQNIFCTVVGRRILLTAMARSQLRKLQASRQTITPMIQRSRSRSLLIRVLRRSVDLMTIARSSNVLMCLSIRATHLRKTWKCVAHYASGCQPRLLRAIRILWQSSLTFGQMDLRNDGMMEWCEQDSVKGWTSRH